MAKAYFNKCPNAKAEYEWTCQPAKTSGRLGGLEEEMEGR
jgi:hypothetical protein